MSHLNLFSGEEPMPALLPNLVYFTRSKYENDWISEKHLHHFTELFYILDGEGTFNLSDKVYHVKKGDLCIIDPYVEHYETSNPNISLEYIVLGIKNIKFDAVKPSKSFYESENPTSGFHCFSDFPHAKKLLDYFENIMTELKKPDDDSKSAMNAYLTLFLIFLKRNTNLSLTHNEYVTYSIEVSIAKKYMDSYYNEEINVDMLAKKAFVSKYYLIHQFKKQVGVTPIKYLMSVRIEAAKNSLVTTNYSVCDISKISGFNNPTYFSSTFTKAVGMSPIAYRQKHSAKSKAKSGDRQ